MGAITLPTATHAPTLRLMMERRSKRSPDRDLALQFLVEALADRSAARAVALVSHDGTLLAGVGMPGDLRGLAKLARPVAEGDDHPELDAITGDTDVFSRRVVMHGEGAFVAALGTRLRRFQDTIDGVARISAS